MHARARFDALLQYCLKQTQPLAIYSPTFSSCNARKKGDCSPLVADKASSLACNVSYCTCTGAEQLCKRQDLPRQVLHVTCICTTYQTSKSQAGAGFRRGTEKEADANVRPAGARFINPNISDILPDHCLALQGMLQATAGKTYLLYASICAKGASNVS